MLKVSVNPRKSPDNLLDAFILSAMTEPLTFTAAAIVSLAFQKAIEAAGSETGKKFATSAYALIDQLRTKIWSKFKGKEKAEAALQKADAGNTEALNAVISYLNVEMLESEDFAKEIQQLAHEINLHVIEDNSSQVQNNYGGTNYQNKISGGVVNQAETINIQN
ncbi:hypothetical protein AM1_H0022 (plasmid) [Acaryochloris marina MBIC11017]|uniref:Uncharacterized protein n=1 Tax=Acaryochloris marina (strain MBIC 11017) TaxID=329726 RepID=A8ZQT9_ACAM1|nr:hypothetical protein AM1_H0022 [Acaryochloris marina MBIC11017]